MVIITERYGSNGRKHYELEELTSGQQTKWVPPREMSRDRHRDALIQIAQRLESVAQQGRMDFSIPITPMQTEATSQTPFGIYATKVFLPRRAPRVAEKTMEGWKQFLRLRILPSFGDVAIGSISAGRLIDFFAGMSSEGLSFHTIERYYSFLSVVFKMATKTGVIKSNPMTMVDKPTPRKDELLDDTVEACTAEEIAALLGIMEKEPLKWRVIIRLLIETGMRVGECMALRWDNIDWKTNAITIRASLGYTAQKGVYVTTPKSRRSRVVYVSDDMMCLLLSHYVANCSNVNSPFVNHREDAPEPMHPQSPGKYLKKLCLRHGLSHIHPHKLRHSYASIAITNGADITSVADNLGHRDSTITLRVYANANVASKKNASNICMNAVLKAAQTA